MCHWKVGQPLQEHQLWCMAKRARPASRQARSRCSWVQHMLPRLLMLLETMLLRHTSFAHGPAAMSHLLFFCKLYAECMGFGAWLVCGDWIVKGHGTLQLSICMSTSASDMGAFRVGCGWRLSQGWLDRCGSLEWKT